MALEAELLVASLKSIKQQLDHVEQAIQELPKLSGICLSEKHPRLRAVCLRHDFAAIGNPHRFENRAQLIRLAGFDLCASRSGEKSSTAVPVISKKARRTCAMRCTRRRWSPPA